MTRPKPTQQELSEFNKYLWLHALSLNASNGAQATGLVGAVAAFGIGYMGNLVTGGYAWSSQQPEKTGEKLSTFGYFVTAGPGFLVGAVTSPFRRAAFLGRVLENSDARVLLFCEGLRNALVSENLLELTKLIDEIVSTYGASSPSSDSSRELLYHLVGRTRMVNMNSYDDPSYHPDEPCRYGHAAYDTSTRIKKIINFLSQEETPLGPNYSKTYLKNQGKRLFNVIMDKLEEKYQYLIPSESSNTRTMQR